MKILKNYLYSMSYQLIAIILPFVTVPYISRVLGSEPVGINAYTTAIITYFVLLANVGLTLYGNRAISYHRDNILDRSVKFWEIVFLKWLMATVSMVTFVIFLFIYGKYKEFLFLQALQIVAAAVDISWFFSGLEDFKKTVGRNAIVKISSAILILLFVKSPSDLGIYILIISGSVLIGNLSLWPYLKKMILPINFSNLSLKSHFFPVLLLFLPQLASQLFMTLNKLFLGNLSTISQTGYFDNADKVIRILLTAITAVGTVIFPRIANSYKNNDFEAVKRYLKLSFDAVNLISFPVAFGLILISTPFSAIYFGSGFKGIEIVLSILAIEIIFMGWSTVFGSQFLVAIDKVKGLTVSVIIATLFMFLGSIVLIPMYGAKGAAVTSVLGEFIIAIIQFMFVSKYIDLRPVIRDCYKFFVSSAFMFITCSIVSKYLIVNNFLKIVILVILGGICYLIALLILKPEIINIKKLKKEFT